MTDTDCRFLARRRALNMVWTAAGEYGFDPVFLAFTQDGLPDFYLNSIIGYVQKWYDRDTMNRLFDTIGNTVLKETLDGLLWIGLENCSFLREVRERPVLSEMRRVCAKSFFNQQLTKSRQQWMSQNSLVYALQSARWRTVLGKEPGLINPWEKKLFEELAFREAWDADQIASHATDIFRRYFRLGQSSLPLSLFAKFRGKAGSLIKKGLPHRVIRAEDLIFTSDSAGNGIITPRKARTFGPISALQEENYRLYIESCFGFPLFGYDENARAEEAFCTGHHRECHLYFASGQRAPHTGDDPLVWRMVRGAQVQADRNRSHYQDKLHFYQNSITRLAEQIRNALLVYPQPSLVRSRSGALAPAEIWRAVWLDDERIFTETFQEEQPDFSVDLMLDASASRLQNQEVIASQAYVIAKSLRLCHIPVQIFSFLSLRGYTVMRLHCGYNDKDEDKKIFDYFAAGWNRDGLALRAARRLMEDSHAKKRILIVLTDASPNDDRRMPSDVHDKHRLSRNYSGEAGVEDSSMEVHSLQKSGIHVMAVLSGGDGDRQAARKIYGDDFVRIENVRNLSDAVGSLLQKQIEKMRS